VGASRAQWYKTPGAVVSGGAHVLALVLLLVNFSRAPRFAEAIETVPVEMITTSELNEISNGEKTAKQLPTPQRRVDKVAEVEDHKPAPPTPDAVKDTPPLPSPDKANDDPGHDETPPEPVSALPPPRPVDPTPPPPTPPERPVVKAETPPPPTPPARPVETAKAEPDEDKPDAEALAPKPPPRPKPAKEAKADPKPDPRPVPVPHARPVDKVAKVQPPVPPKRSEPDPKPNPLLDVAKLLDKMKPPKPVTKQRSGNEVKEAKSHDDFSLDKITALLDHEAPQRRASTGRALTQLASLGSPTAHAEKLSPSMAAQLDGWLIDHYRGCWSYFGLGASQDYVPQLRIRMAPDGSLIGQPALLNPPSDPNLRSLADSAIRAVNRCNPLEIPDRFKPFYDEGYKLRVVRFDPKEMS
jgi:colicin import membrane protein